MQRLGEEGIDSIQQISVIETNTNTVIGSPIPVESFPSVIAYDPVNEWIYVTNRGVKEFYYLQDSTLTL